MSIEQLIGYIGYAALALSGYFFVRGNAAKSTIDVLEANNAALKEQNDILRSQNETYKAEMHNLQGKVDVLKDLVTGSSAIKALAEEITASFKKIHENDKKIAELLEQLLAKSAERKP